MLFTSRYSPPKLGKAFVVSNSGIKWDIDIFKTCGDGAVFLAAQDKNFKQVASRLISKDITIVGKRWGENSESFIVSGSLENNRVLLYGFYVHNYTEMITIVCEPREIFIIGEYNQVKNSYKKIPPEELPFEYSQKVSKILKKIDEKKDLAYFFDKNTGDLLIINGYSSCWRN